MPCHIRADAFPKRYIEQIVTQGGLNLPCWQICLANGVTGIKCHKVIPECRTVHDFKSRRFDAEQCNILCNFAEMTVREIQRITESGIQRAMSLNPSPENEQLLRSIDDCSDGVVLLDVRVAGWPVLFSNEGWVQLTGMPESKQILQPNISCLMR